MSSTWNLIGRSLWVIIFSIVIVMGIFYFYGKTSESKEVVSTIYIIPNTEIPQSNSYSGNDVIQSAGYFAGVVRSWLTDPQFTADAFKQAGQTPSDSQLVTSPFVVTVGQSPLAYQLSLKTSSANVDQDTNLLKSGLSVLQQRMDDFNTKAESKLRFTIETDPPLVTTSDNTSQLLKFTAPLLGFFVGLFIVIARETYRRRPQTTA